MTYEATLADDIARAKEILAKGRPAHDEVAYLPEPMRAAALTSGTIYGADVYVAYKLLESFVEVLERPIATLISSQLNASLVGAMRDAVAAGAGHECEEWWSVDGRCVLCDRRR